MDIQDLRHKMFKGMDWYEAISQPLTDDRPSVYWLTKAPYEDHRHRWLAESLIWIEQHGLWDKYHERFAGLKDSGFDPHHAKATNRRVSSSIADIAYEPLAALLLERFLHWQYMSRETSGKDTRFCDWEFVTPNGLKIHAEVKTISSISWAEDDGSMIYGSGTKEVQSALSRAIEKFKKSDVANLVLIGDYLGYSLFDAPDHLDGVSRALFGHIRIPVYKEIDGNIRWGNLGPSFHDMFVQPGKNTRLSGILCFRPSNDTFFGIRCRVYHNPWAKVPIDPSCFGSLRQCRVTENRNGMEWVGEECVDWSQLSTEG